MLAADLAAAASAEDYLRNAQEFLDKGEVKAAAIELKNTLRADPTLVEARLMLGKIYVRLGDGPSAEKELKRAERLRAPRERWVSALAEAYLLQGKYQEVLDEIQAESNLAPDLRASLLTHRGLANLGLAQPDMADELFSTALALNPDFEPALLGKIQLAIKRNELEKAGKFTDELLEKSPNNDKALLIRAELDRHAGRNQEAVVLFDRLLKQNPEHLQGRLGRAAALTASGKPDAALKDLDFLEQKRTIPMVQYMRAVIAFQKQDLKGALEYAERVLSAAPDHAQSILLYGAANYGLGHLETAEPYLARAVTALPGNLRAAKLYAAVKMKLGHPKEAIRVLEPHAADSDDAQLLALLGSAYMMSGNHAKGSELLAKAVEKAPSRAALRTQLAVGLLAGGETGQAISELKSAVELGQDLMQADVLLVLTQLREKNYTGALKSSEALEKRMPDSAIPYNLTGLAWFAKGDYDLAEQRFRKALEVDPDFFTARMNLARLYIARGNDKGAERQYREVLKKTDNNLGAMLGLAALARKKGDQAGALEWLKKAREANPDAVQPGLLLTELYVQSGESLKALNTASELFGRYPNDPRVLLALGTAQLSAGETNSAIGSFETLINRRGASAQLLNLLATAQTNIGYYDKARDSYKQAIALAPDNRNLKLALGSMEIRAGRHARAMEIAQELQKVDPELASAYDLEGAARLGQHQRAAAISAYDKANSLQPTSGRALLLSRLYQESGDPKKATTVLQDWLKYHPDDLVVGTNLALTFQQRGLSEQAITAYERVYRINPNNMVVLNNLAWLYFQKDDPRALELGAKAYELAPRRPEVVDTYGWILLSSGNSEKALVILQEALVSAPDNAEITYHVAVAMDKAGRRDEARKLLSRLFRGNPSFSEADKAKDLLKRLGG